MKPEDILTYLGCNEWDDDEWIAHYGVGHLNGGHSGRYAWGSGDDPLQTSKDRRTDFLDRIDRLKKDGWEETPENIKKEFGLTTTQYRTEKAVCKDERRLALVNTAKRLRDEENMGATEIGRQMGLPESSVRSLLNDKSESKMLQARNTAEHIKKLVDEKGMVDVGADESLYLGVSKEKLNQALYLLEREGYPVYKGGIPQATNPGQQTNQRVVCRPGTEHNISV